MAKFDELFEDVQEVFDSVIALTDLGHLIKFKVITNDKLKTIGKVQKANDLTKYLGDVDVVIIINQFIFNQLPIDMQENVAIELLTYVGYDNEKDNIIIAKPDVNTFSGILKKLGYDEYEKIQLCIKSLYDKKQNDENTGEVTV